MNIIKHLWLILYDLDKTEMKQDVLRNLSSN